MKSKINLITIFSLLMLSFFTCNKHLYADQIKDDIEKIDTDLSKVQLGDSFNYKNNNYTISQINLSDIYINNQKVDIYNFEANISDGTNETWRKYVKFSDLCSDDKICKDFSENNQIALRRSYSNTINKSNVYYTTKYTNSSKTFESRLIVGDDSYNFNSFKDENSIFNNEGILTADVEPLVDSNNDLYISLRFVTEALGAEVSWSQNSNSDSKDIVNINFYDSDEYCKTINITYEKTCKNVEDDELNKIQSCNNNDLQCLSDRCERYIKNNLNSLDDSFQIIADYNYIDIKDNLRTFEVKVKKEEMYIDTKDAYMIIMYNGVPLPYNILNNNINSKCKDDSYEEKLECLQSGKSWISDEASIKLSEKNGPFCAINLTESVSSSGSK